MNGSILQLKITLEESTPKIWRRFLVSDFWNFDKLHRIIQKVMGWENYHLYEFDVDGIKIGLKDEDIDYELKNAKTTRLFEYLGEKGQKFEYVYDFGDSWEHKIVIEEISKDDIEKQVEIPVCLAGENACPPEDCGGTGGYEDLLKIRKNKKHPEYKEKIVDWLGEDFDPKKFDIDDVNRELNKR